MNLEHDKMALTTTSLWTRLTDQEDVLTGQ